MKNTTDRRFVELLTRLAVARQDTNSAEPCFFGDQSAKSENKSVIASEKLVEHKKRAEREYVDIRGESEQREANNRTNFIPISHGLFWSD